jgi:hypothetical protein
MIRAIRKRYLARSDGASVDQPSVKAPRAASTAAPTSSALPCATSVSVSSVDGETVGNHWPERGSTTSPPM